MKIRIGTLFIIIFNICLLISCSQNVEDKYLFYGENKDWIVEYKIQEINRREGNYQKLILEISYKNELAEIDNLKTLEYSITDGSSFLKNSIEFGENNKNFKKKFATTFYSHESINYTEDSMLKVEINVNGSIETIFLKLAKTY